MHDGHFLIFFRFSWDHHLQMDFVVIGVEQGPGKFIPSMGNYLHARTYVFKILSGHDQGAVGAKRRNRQVVILRSPVKH